MCPNGLTGKPVPLPKQPMGYRGNRFNGETSQRVTGETSPMLSQRDTGETILLQWVTGETFPPFARVIACVGLPGKPFQGFPGNPSWDGFPGNPKGVTWKPFCKVYRRNLPGNGLPRKPLAGNGLPGKPLGDSQLPSRAQPTPPTPQPPTPRTNQHPTSATRIANCPGRRPISILLQRLPVEHFGTAIGNVSPVNP